MIVSIIIPAFNCENTMEKCLHSITEQTYKNLEIIIIDDGSTDDTFKICNEIASNDERINLIHQNNFGQSVARNVGLSIFSGDYVLFVDSDDYLEKNMVSTMINTIVEYNADIAICGLKYISKKCTKDLFMNESYLLEEKDKILGNFLTNSYGFGPTNKMYNSELIKDFRFTEGIIFEDFEFLTRLFPNINRLVTVKEAGYIYVVNPSSTTQKDFNSGKFDLIRVTDLMYTAISENHALHINEARALRIENYYTVLKMLLKGNKEKEFRSEYKQIILLLKGERKYCKNNPYIKMKFKIIIFGLSFNNFITTRLLKALILD